MADQRDWPDAPDYGKRFEEIDGRLQKSFANAEFRWRDSASADRLRYRLAKLSIAAEDIQRAMTILTNLELGDDEKSNAIVELRNACHEITESFDEIDGDLVALLNRTSD